MRIAWGLLWISAVASASSLPAEWIVGRIAEARKGIDWAVLEYRVDEMDGGEPSGASVREIVDVDFLGAVVTSRFIGPSEQLLFVHRRVFTNEDAASFGSSAYLLFSTNRDATVLSLLRKGVPIPIEADMQELKTAEERRALEKQTVKRWEDKAIWVIGFERDPEKTPPLGQLWVEKGAFHPARLVWFPYGPTGDRRELRFRRFSATRSLWYPSEVTALKNDQPELRGEILPKNIAGLSRKSKKDRRKIGARKKIINKLSPGWTEEGESASSSVKSLIEAYVEALR